jgi:hypothetical protein
MRLASLFLDRRNAHSRGNRTIAGKPGSKDLVISSHRRSVWLDLDVV